MVFSPGCPIEIVIEGVAATSMRRRPRTSIITLHDAIYCKSAQVDNVVRAFEEEFAVLDYPMRWRVTE